MMSWTFDDLVTAQGDGLDLAISESSNRRRLGDDTR